MRLDNSEKGGFKNNLGLWRFLTRKAGNRKKTRSGAGQRCLYVGTLKREAPFGKSDKDCDNRKRMNETKMSSISRVNIFNFYFNSEERVAYIREIAKDVCERCFHLDDKFVSGTRYTIMFSRNNTRGKKVLLLLYQQSHLLK